MKSFTRPVYPDTDRPLLARLVPLSAERILDIGCNQGKFGYSLKASRPNIEVWGVEPDRPSALIAKERIDRVIVDTFHEDNPLPDDYFDLIAFNDSLEHMADPAQALFICQKKLRKGGKVLCCVPNVRHIENLEHLIIDRDWRYEDEGIRDKTHLRFFTEKSITRLFIECGFIVDQVVGVNEDWWDKKKLIRRVFFRLFPEFTQGMKYVQLIVLASLPVTGNNQIP